MSFDYSSFASLALNMIAKYGAPAILRKASQEYDPVSGVMGEKITEVQFMAVMTKPSEAAISQGLVQTGDGILLVAGDSLKEQPHPGATIIWNNEEWRIVSYETVAPAFAVLLYKLLVRRA